MQDKAVEDSAAKGVGDLSAKAQEGRRRRLSTSAGIRRYFAAIGLAVGAIGTALAAVLTGFLSLSWWEMPLAVGGLMLLISGPSMIMAYMKLRQRNLGLISTPMAGR